MNENLLEFESDKNCLFYMVKNDKLYLTLINELSKTLKVAYQIINDDQFLNKKILDLRVSKHLVITNE